MFNFLKRDEVVVNKNLGWTDCMGPQLREYVKRSLVEDLKNYILDGTKISLENCVFDWSETCVEGHRMSYLDGEMENFSGIVIFDNDNNMIIDGWMDFIEDEGKVYVFWWFLKGGDKYNIKEKKRSEIPEHIWNKLSAEIKQSWEKHRPLSGLPGLN